MSLTVLAPVAPRPLLHFDPPATPSSFFASRRRLLLGIIALFGLLAVAAVTANSWLLLRWDKPFQHFVESNRSYFWDVFFRSASRLGSTAVVLSVGTLMAALTWGRCRAVSIAVVVATLARTATEFVLKELVERDRPNLDRMVDGVGYSFPSGHVMASVALWGLLPVVVGLFTTSRRLWWTSVAVSGFLILAISFSRVYLGVHWLSDIVAGMLVGTLFLIGVEWVLHRAHGVTGCAVHTHTHAHTHSRR